MTMAQIAYNFCYNIKRLKHRKTRLMRLIPKNKMSHSSWILRLNVGNAAHSCHQLYLFRAYTQKGELPHYLNKVMVVALDVRNLDSTFTTNLRVEY